MKTGEWRSHHAAAVRLWKQCYVPNPFFRQAWYTNYKLPIAVLIRRMSYGGKKGRAAKKRFDAHVKKFRPYQRGPIEQHYLGADHE